MTRTFILTLMATLLLTLALPADGWCNRREQKGRNTAAAETYELPEVSSAAPFRFDRPDPRRQLRQIDYRVDPNGKSVYQVVLSDRLSPTQAADAQESILGLLTERLCHPEDVLTVWSGELRRIATFRSDERVRDCASSNAVRFKVHRNRTEIARFNQHLERFKAENLPGRADLNVPHVVHHLGQEFHEYPDYPNRSLVLFGSAIHVGADGQSTLLEGAYPTVGMLRAPLSPFSTRDRAWYLGNTVTHYIVTDRFSERVHRDGLENFWAAYFISLGSPLLTFSSDPQVADRVLNPDLPGIPAYVDDINPGYVSVRPVQLFADDVSENGTPTRLERGAVTIGLKWAGEDLDLDLHVALRGKGDRLSFRLPETSFGTLTKRYGSGWEVAQLNQEVRPEEVEIWVNFYAGNAPPGGVEAELRVSYAGTLYRKPLTLTAPSGNRGQAGSSTHWQRLNLADVVAATY